MINPDAATLNYFQSRGVTLIRLPVRWERLQPVPMGPLDETEITRVATVLDQAKARGMVLLIDLHNYGRFNGKILGTSQLPIETMADFWVRFAKRFTGHAGLAGYGLMNGPNNLPNATIWPSAAQLAVTNIRQVDKKTRIYVAGDQWSSAAGWEQVNANLAISDPNDNFRYEAHQYFDPNGSGKYAQSYAAANGTPTIGVTRLQPFLNFLKRTNSKGFIGEVGVPTADPAYHVALDNFLRAATDANVEVTYWAAGVWWKNYILSVQPIDGVDKPQWSVISKYIPAAGSACS